MGWGGGRSQENKCRKINARTVPALKGPQGGEQGLSYKRFPLGPGAGDLWGPGHRVLSRTRLGHEAAEGGWDFHGNI